MYWYLCIVYLCIVYLCICVINVFVYLCIWVFLIKSSDVQYTIDYFVDSLTGPQNQSDNHHILFPSSTKSRIVGDRKNTDKKMFGKYCQLLYLKFLIDSCVKILVKDFTWRKRLKGCPLCNSRMDFPTDRPLSDLQQKRRAEHPSHALCCVKYQKEKTKPGAEKFSVRILFLSYLPNLLKIPLEHFFHSFVTGSNFPLHLHL